MPSRPPPRWRFGGCAGGGHQAAAVARPPPPCQASRVVHADARHWRDSWPRTSPPRCSPWPASTRPSSLPATAHGKNVAPRVAAGLDVAQISDVTRVVSLNTFERPIYAGNAIATVRSKDRIKVLTARTTAFDAAPVDGGDARLVLTPAPWQDAGTSLFVGAEIARLDRPELTAAKIIVSGGRGLGSGGEVRRSADASGRRVGRRAWREPGRGRCRLCAQRLAGRADGQDRRAAAVRGLRHLRRHPAPGRHEGLEGDRRDQQDPEAPIFSVADYGLEADLFEVVPELTAALRT